jgi:amino-acid N-acetyltransferase
MARNAGGRVQVTVSIQVAVPAQWRSIKQLVEQGALPTEDLDETACANFLVAAERGQLRGVIALELAGSSALLRSLVVRPEQRGRGIAKALVAKAEERAQAAQVHDIYLLTNTVEPFFAALGYLRITRDVAPPDIQLHPQFRTLCPQSAALMRKTLGV